MNKHEYLFTIEFTVRDYECDLQGIVNNACYFNYLEHTRHQYIKKNGLDFAEMHKNGIDPVVVRAELDYKYPLTSGDSFTVCVNVEKKGRTRLVFYQDIFRLPDEKLICKALIYVVCLKSGKPIKPDFFTSLMTKMK